jgi:large subunit ribosomal protein L32e
MTAAQALKLRKAIKNKKPDFLHDDYQKRKCIPLRWRKPHGLHSKVRHRFAGHTVMPDPGFGSPASVRGLHPSGLEPVVVHTLTEIAKLTKAQGAVLGSTVGIPRRVALLAKAKELGIRVLNVKDIDAELKLIQESIAARKEAKTAASKAKEAKAKEKEKATAKKPELEKKVSEEEQKKQEKEEKDKVLTQKQ